MTVRFDGENPSLVMEIVTSAGVGVGVGVGEGVGFWVGVAEIRGVGVDVSAGVAVGKSVGGVEGSSVSGVMVTEVAVEPESLFGDCRRTDQDARPMRITIPIATIHVFCIVLFSFMLIPLCLFYI